MIVHKRVVTDKKITVHKRVVTDKKTAGISLSDSKETSSIHSYALNMCNTRQSEIFTQLNFVGCLGVLKGGYI